MTAILNKKTLSVLTLIFSLFFATAQEIIPEKQPVKTITQQGGKQKVDGIVATVGDYIILDSEIDKSFIELQSQGANIKDISRCQMLGKLLEDKLYAHQAIQDSVIVNDEEIKEKMNQQIDYMVEQIGSMEKVVKYFKKNDTEEFKTELFDILKQQKLSSEMQQKIIGDITITPEETRNFFKKIPENERPIIGTELEIAQIVVKPKVSEADKQVVIDKLNQIKKDVQEGSSFTTKAVLYTEDPGSRSTGGYYKINRKTPFVKEFKDVAFSMQEGKISDPFETEFGFHIIYLEKIKGQDLELRHILMIPKVSDQALNEAKEKINLIKKRINDKEITFAEAARTMSDEKETRNNGGQLINPKTQDTHFELTKMDSELYSEVVNLKNNEISRTILEDDPRSGKKFKIITITNRIDEHTADYAKDYTKIRELALKEKQINAIGKWTDEKIKETYIKINNDYKNCDFTNNWVKK
jgi:peptidyl-prolyl cis-trans isomerase SurA